LRCHKRFLVRPQFVELALQFGNFRAVTAPRCVEPLFELRQLGRLPRMLVGEVLL
jgi:hypothetical protein